MAPSELAQRFELVLDSEREVVEVFTTWERNYPYPMDAEEALEKGLIQPAVEQLEPLIDPDTGEIADMAERVGRRLELLLSH